MASYGAIEFERVGIMTDFEYTDDLFGEDNSTLTANNAADTYAERGNYKRCQKFGKYPLSGKGGKYAETRGHKERADNALPRIT